MAYDGDDRTAEPWDLVDGTGDDHGWPRLVRRSQIEAWESETRRAVQAEVHGITARGSGGPVAAPRAESAPVRGTPAPQPSARSPEDGTTGPVAPRPADRRSSEAH